MERPRRRWRGFHPHLGRPGHRTRRRDRRVLRSWLPYAPSALRRPHPWPDAADRVGRVDHPHRSSVGEYGRRISTSRRSVRYRHDTDGQSDWRHRWNRRANDHGLSGRARPPSGDRGYFDRRRAGFFQLRRADARGGQSNAHRARGNPPVVSLSRCWIRRPISISPVYAPSRA